MEKYSFFNSVNGDRKYKAEDYAGYFSKFITNGVFPNVSSNLQVIADTSNMQSKVKAGAAWINGYMYYNDSDLILTHDVADGVLNRIDRIVVKLDFQQRLMKSYIKKGAFASAPVAPTLQRDADGYELGLADVYIGAGMVGIMQSNVTDLRLNNDLCGIVNSLLQADTTTIFNQYQSWFDIMKAEKEGDFTTWSEQQRTDFDAWFATIQGQLSTDAAGNLQNQINTLTNTVNDNKTNSDNKVDDINKHSVLKSNKDIEGIYTSLELKRLDGTLYMTSTLSGGSPPTYTTRTEVFYATDGTTVESTVVYTRTYDTDNILVSEVPV